MKKFGTGKRYNNNKPRYELLYPKAIEDLVNVLTKGAKKYSEFDSDGNLIYDGGYNWRNGLPWSEVLASLKRHIAAFECGEEYDKETGEYHIAHAAANIHFLNSFYYIFPEGDDRIRGTLDAPKIAIDIDGVICDFYSSWARKYGFDVENKPNNWNFDRKMLDRIEEMKKNGELDEFFLSLKPLIDPAELPFEPVAYVTLRSVSKEITEKWIDLNGFPPSPVYCVGVDGDSKSEILNKIGVDHFVEDSYEEFKNIKNSGLICYLLDANYNKRYNVGHFRIKSLNELPWFK